MSIRLPDELYELRGGTPVTGVVGFPLKKGNEVTFDTDEGLVTNFEDLAYPRPQVLDPYALSAADNVKKYINGWLSFFMHPFSLATWLEHFAGFCYVQTGEYWMEERFRPRMVRELLRVGKLHGIDHRIMKSIGVIFEQDLNYRFPFQDVMSCLDAGALRRDAAKEVLRLMELLDARWHFKQSQWKKKGKLLYYAIKCLPPLRRFIISFGASLDISKMELRKWDLYNCLLIEAYDYLGMTLEQRKKLHETL